MKLYDITDFCKKGHELKNYPFIATIELENCNFGDMIEVDGEFYTVGIAEWDNQSLGVRKTKLKTGKTDTFSELLECPFCGYKDDCGFELQDCEENYQCGQCGSIMSYERTAIVSHEAQGVVPPVVIKAEIRKAQMQQPKKGDNN